MRHAACVVTLVCLFGVAACGGSGEKNAFVPAEPSATAAGARPAGPEPTPAGSVTASATGVSAQFASITATPAARTAARAATSAPTPPAASPTSTPTPTSTPVPPEARTYQALLAAPFAAERLPGGFSAPKVVDANSFLNGLTSGHHAAGEVDVLLSGPDERDAIIYLIFPSAADAEAVLAGQTPGADLLNVASETVDGFAYPVKCNSFGAGAGAAGGSIAGITLCNGLIGPVEVIGYSQLQYDPDAEVHGGNRDHALALLQAGAEHLASVQPEP